MTFAQPELIRWCRAGTNLRQFDRSYFSLRLKRRRTGLEATVGSLTGNQSVARPT